MMNVYSEIDREKLSQVAAEAVAKLDPQSAADRRWLNCIAKAVAEVETNPYLTFEPNNKSLLMLSESSGQIYSANGTCQCKAFEFGNPCFHRALARLIVRYLETQ
jgi:hypothetical protein